MQEAPTVTRAATARFAALAPWATPIGGNTSSEIAMPIGHELTKMAMAVESSLPANQSATILVINTPISTLPTPATSRPEIWPLQEDENAMMQLPAIIR